MIFVCLFSWKVNHVGFCWNLCYPSTFMIHFCIVWMVNHVVLSSTVHLSLLDLAHQIQFVKSSTRRVRCVGQMTHSKCRLTSTSFICLAVSTPTNPHSLTHQCFSVVMFHSHAGVPVFFPNRFSTHIRTTPDQPQKTEPELFWEDNWRDAFFGPAIPQHIYIYIYYIQYNSTTPPEFKMHVNLLFA